MIRLEVTAENPTIYSGDCSVMIGTSGYSYTEWIDGGFYPPGIKTSEMLYQYARQFQVVELNYTWYQMARAEAISRLVEKSPTNFLFAAKITRTLTHERNSDWAEQLAMFKDGIEPLRPQLLALLIQLPPDFERTVANRRYLAHLLDGLADYPVAVEFRHHSWASDGVYAELRRRRVSLVCVDSPAIDTLFPLSVEVTNPDLFYIRFHGRNALGWKSSNIQKKFDYNYSTAELQDWYNDYLKKIITTSSRGVVFFNNHVHAQAPANARKFAQLLAAQG